MGWPKLLRCSGELTGVSGNAQGIGTDDTHVALRQVSNPLTELFETLQCTITGLATQFPVAFQTAAEAYRLA